MRYYDEVYEDSGMTMHFNHEKIVVTRKPHKCFHCPYIMPAGTKANKFWHYWSEADGPEGGYECLTHYWHDVCMHRAQQAKEKYEREHETL